MLLYSIIQYIDYGLIFYIFWSDSQGIYARDFLGSPEVSETLLVLLLFVYLQVRFYNMMVMLLKDVFQLVKIYA